MSKSMYWFETNQMVLNASKFQVILFGLNSNESRILEAGGCSNDVANSVTLLGVTISPVHKFLGNFSATLGFFSNFQYIGHLLGLRVTVMLLMGVKQLESAEYSLCPEYICPILYLKKHRHAELQMLTGKKLGKQDF